MTCLEDYLALHAKENGMKDAVVCDSGKISYAELYVSAKQKATEFSQSGNKAIVVRNTQDLKFIITYFAAHIAHIPVVPLEKDIPESKMTDIIDVVENNDIDDNTSDILFTTGTTGKQKGVMISKAAILANAENLISAQGFTCELAFIVCGPLNHIGSLSKLWPMIVIGGTIIITEGLKNMDSFFNVLAYPYCKFATFLVPASIRMLLRFEEKRLIEVANKLDFIETGGAALMENDMEELCKVLPNARLYNTYASTETGIISTHDYCKDGCISGCVGHVMRHSEVSITEDGYISCKGKTLMSGYIGDKHLTQSILRNGVLYTSDIGSFDSDNRLMIHGRKGDVINIGAYKVMPTDIEDVVSAYPGISDCICISVPHPIMGNVLKLIYSIDSTVSLDKKAFIKYLRQNMESYKVPLIYEQAEFIQRTYNGKLNRRYYTK